MSILHVGLDIGSTTAKAVVLDESDHIVFSRYTRHFADVRSAAVKLVMEIKEHYIDSMFTVAVAGSGAIELARGMEIPFTQELIACSASIGRYLPDVDVCIELGGEDAKLTFFDPAGADQRMNETCAGGTGAFIDQMASLIGTDAAGLNELAKGCGTIYPIASRCGVFAKTDIQPLLNDGAAREDIAASIFQAIVNQTISGLACGRRITGSVAFLGGPLYFLSELRKRFAETLELTPEQCIFPENPHLYVAIGAAISGKNSSALNMETLGARAERFFSSRAPQPVSILPALFLEEGSREAFAARHGASRVTRRSLEGYRGGAYLGVDVGSTTTKTVLISEEGELLFSRYNTNNGGEPLLAVRRTLLELYSAMPEGVEIKSSGVTGYGEKLAQAALGIDIGEVETVAHARAARFVEPDADFVIDIGGQDMKCLGIEDGVIKRVFLNEACSSGCGSFLQSFAESLEMSMEDFAAAAERSMMPVDLGSRCTVFMNSRVRQAQKEGASVDDISAGLVYSVVRNALYKVLKIKSPADLGKKIVVQGGAFKNDALLRAFELVTKREVVRPAISELMGAFGAALLARDRCAGGASALLSAEKLEAFAANTATRRCGGCGNRCILTVAKFGDGRSYVSGNRCENGAPSGVKAELPPNLFEKKYARLFGHYVPLPEQEAPLGVIGVPRALNMYENYPFWFTFLTEIGFCVKLSAETPDESLGIDTIASQTLCYPAKLVNRHISELLARGVKRIFFPILQRERNEFADAHQNFNCPVVTGYPDVARLNIDGLRAAGVEYISPAVAIENERAAASALFCEFSRFGLSSVRIISALKQAYRAQEEYKRDIERFGEETIEYLKKNGGRGIILAGHPYHLDPEVHHGIPQLINRYGVAVFTEDSVCGKAAELEKRDGLDVIDQWVYHSRLYRSAMVAAAHPDFKEIELVQLNSFGCGLDAISADQTAALLEKHGRLHTLIKIDEGKNNGAVKIRIRSLLAAVEMKNEFSGTRKKAAENVRAAGPATAMAERTILCPPLSSHHFQFMETAFEACGIKLKVLPEGTRDTIELGLKYVNNDACYPAMLVVGQFLQALQSGECDPDKTDCLYAQTGGACRAGNYVPLLRKALDAAGFGQVRILAVNAQGNRGAEKFSVPPGVMWRALLGLFYGDLLMRLSLQTRPYELTAGSTNELYARWASEIKDSIRRGSWRQFKRDVRDIVGDFARLPVDGKPRRRVGIVGEILVKYHANANENLVRLIEDEGGEAVVPDLANFLLYCLFDPVCSARQLSGSVKSALAGWLGIKVMRFFMKPVDDALRGTRFGGTHDIRGMAKDAAGIVSCANQGGEGWLLTAEMMKLLEGGIKNVLCVQPFACLPNHITGKGVIKELKRRYEGANILALDYDASVSTTNQLNRIKLLMASART